MVATINQPKNGVRIFTSTLANDARQPLRNSMSMRKALIINLIEQIAYEDSKNYIGHHARHSVHIAYRGRVFVRVTRRADSVRLVDCDCLSDSILYCLRQRLKQKNK